MERRTNKKPGVRGIPSCTGGGYAVIALTHSERHTQNVFCHECGTRFVIEDENAQGKKAFVFPAHKVPVTVHEYREKLERETSEAKARDKSRVA